MFLPFSLLKEEINDGNRTVVKLLNIKRFECFELFKDYPVYSFLLTRRKPNRQKHIFHFHK